MLPAGPFSHAKYRRSRGEEQIQMSKLKVQINVKTATVKELY
jgi:hypothetical protein